MAAALASADSKSFWQQVHRVNKSKSSIPASSVDGVSGADHISHLFSTKLSGILLYQPSAALLLRCLLQFSDMVTCLNNLETAFLSLSPRPIKILLILTVSYHPISLALYPEYFTTSGLQFGFREKMFTTLCMLFHASYMQEDTSVFACFLDA